jgi:hypothetical protein
MTVQYLFVASTFSILCVQYTNLMKKLHTGILCNNDAKGLTEYILYTSDKRSMKIMLFLENMIMVGLRIQPLRTVYTYCRM